MRELFIKKAIEYDNFYSHLGRDNISEISDKNFYFRSCNNVYRVFKELLDENNCASMKEYMSKIEKENNINHLSHFEIKRIREITLKNANPFLFFYDFDDESLFNLFEILAETHQSLKYYNVYSSSYRNLKDDNRTSKNSKLKTLFDTIDIIKEFPNTDKLQDEIFCIIKSFSINYHYTEMQLFQNFLYRMYYFLIDLKYQDKNKLKNFTKSKIIQIVNSIINEYYSEEKIKFTTAIKIENFRNLTYFYDTAKGINLYHI